MFNVKENEVEDHLFDNPVEAYISDFSKTPYVNVIPTSIHWSSRVALEIKNIMSYLEYMKSTQREFWFFLKPCKDKKYNFQRWDGYLTFPSRLDILFDMRIILTSEYLNVYPRAFAEEKIKKYCFGNYYPKNIWEDSEPDSKKFVMICHDHMDTLKGWNPSLDIIHYLLREVRIWWMSRTNNIIKLWDKELLII